MVGSTLPKHLANPSGKTTLKGRYDVEIKAGGVFECQC
jgi:hypothetical protein